MLAGRWAPVLLDVPVLAPGAVPLCLGVNREQYPKTPVSHKAPSQAPSPELYLPTGSTESGNVGKHTQYNEPSLFSLHTRDARDNCHHITRTTCFTNFSSSAILSEQTPAKRV